MSEAVYVFDLDGVITDPKNSHVNEEVVELIYRLLEAGTYLAVNTGRSYDWVESNLISRLKAHNNSEIFNRFITVCEKGGETVKWQNDQVSVQPSEFALHIIAQQITRKTFELNQSRLRSMFWDDTKRTMATVEKKPKADIKQFHNEQHLLVEKLKDSLKGHDIRIDPTTIATDVESPAAGKYAGAKLIYQWIQQTAPSLVNSFISIGDSSSDYDMARYFAEQEADSVFVYVGKPTNNISHHEKVTLVSTSNKYAAGALEFLSIST